MKKSQVENKNKKNLLQKFKSFAARGICLSVASFLLGAMSPIQASQGNEETFTQDLKIGWNLVPYEESGEEVFSEFFVGKDWSDLLSEINDQVRSEDYFMLQRGSKSYLINYEGKDYIITKAKQKKRGRKSKAKRQKKVFNFPPEEKKVKAEDKIFIKALEGEKSIQLKSQAEEESLSVASKDSSSPTKKSSSKRTRKKRLSSAGENQEKNKAQLVIKRGIHACPPALKEKYPEKCAEKERGSKEKFSPKSQNLSKKKRERNNTR